jgi:hypothetical protein
MTTAFDEAMFNSMPPTQKGGAAFARFLDALRRVGDVTLMTDPDDDEWTEAAAQLERVAELLEFSAVEPEVSPAGRRPDLPGPGHPLLPAFRMIDRDR